MPDHIDTAADALHNAVLTVANAVSTNEADLTFLFNASRLRDPERAAALREILDALAAWKTASQHAFDAMTDRHTDTQDTREHLREANSYRWPD